MGKRIFWKGPLNAKGERMETEKRKTWIDPEEYAYPSGTLRHSTRKGRVRCADGVIRTVLLSVSDTFFSIPARVYAYKKTRGIL